MDEQRGRSDPAPLLAPSTPASPAAVGEEWTPPGSRPDPEPGANPGGPDRTRRSPLPDRLGGWLRRRGPIYAVIALGGFAGGNARYAFGLVARRAGGHSPGRRSASTSPVPSSSRCCWC